MSLRKFTPYVMEHMIYGYVNGEAVYSRDEFVYKAREGTLGRCGAITSDEELLAFSKKVSGWQSAGHAHNFADFYLSTYALAEPYSSLTKKEFNRLKQLQQEERAKIKAEDDALEWEYVETIYWADNSEEAIWINKYGEKKSIMVIAPHGDVC